MREPVRDRERLEHIKDAIERIQDNVKTVSLDNLSSNVLVFYGIVKNIEIIGEAAYNLTNAFRWQPQGNAMEECHEYAQYPRSRLLQNQGESDSLCHRG